MDNDVMLMLGTRWCEERADFLAEELTESFRKKTSHELLGVPPSVVRSIWNRAILQLFLEVNLPEELYEQTLGKTRDSRLFEDFQHSAGKEALGQLLSLAEDVRAWRAPSGTVDTLATEATTTTDDHN